MTTDKPYVVAFSTIQSGLVLRWYTDVAGTNQVLNAGREGVTELVEGLPLAWVNDAEIAHDLLRTGYEKDRETAKAMATHERCHFLCRHDLQPLAAVEADQ